MYIWDDEQEQMAGWKKPREAFEAKMMDSPTWTRGVWHLLEANFVVTTRSSVAAATPKCSR